MSEQKKCGKCGRKADVHSGGKFTCALCAIEEIHQRQKAKALCKSVCADDTYLSGSFRITSVPHDGT